VNKNANVFLFDLYIFSGKCEQKCVLIGSNAGVTSVDIDFDVSVECYSNHLASLILIKLFSVTTY
jgi:hypothetical protein